MGRPKLELDWEQFDDLCRMHCTLIEIAAWFNMSEDTIERRIREKHGVTFAELFRTKSVPGKVSVRRKQFQMAMAGNVKMLEHLGEHWLGQSRVQKVDLQAGVGTIEEYLKANEVKNEEVS